MEDLDLPLRVKEALHLALPLMHVCPTYGKHLSPMVFNSVEDLLVHLMNDHTLEDLEIVVDIQKEADKNTRYTKHILSQGQPVIEDTLPLPEEAIDQPDTETDINNLDIE